MKKIYLILFVAQSLSCMLLAGMVVMQGASPNQQYIVEFLSSGRYEIVYVHQCISDIITTTGLHQVYISRNINEPWRISFTVTKLETTNVALYVSIKTIDGEALYNTAIGAHDGYISMDCNLICDNLSK